LEVQENDCSKKGYPEVQIRTNGLPFYCLVEQEVKT